MSTRRQRIGTCLVLEESALEGEEAMQHCVDVIIRDLWGD